MPSIIEIRRLLARRQPRLLPTEGRRHAAVALLLRQGKADPEVLFIERASHEGDPWSGDIGFPGGKIEPGDRDPRRAAERESLEEVGLDLRGARHLGRLDDIAGAHLPVVVSCFVYEVARTCVLTLSEELSDAFWIPLPILFDPERHHTATVHFRGEPLERPAIDLLGPGRVVLWGITFRLIRQFQGIISREDEAVGRLEACRQSKNEKAVP